MNDTTQDSWFYSREGERLGPVTFDDLHSKATDGMLDPRLDMVWTQGMAEWKPSGEIEGLFERRPTPGKPESLAPPVADPYPASYDEPVAEQLAQGGDWPGARRRSYLIALFIFPILWSVGLTAGTGFLNTQFGPQIMGYALPGLMLVPLLVAIVFGVKRLANLGMSRWWYLGNLIPILNVWIGYRCFACPAGYALHKKLDGAGIFLSIIYWLIFVVVLLAIAVVVGAMYGAIGSPELQQKIQEFLREAAPPKP